VKQTRSLAILFASAAVLLGTAGARAQDASQPVVEPETLVALNRMGAALQALTDFSLEAETTRESVLETGQKLQYGGTLQIVAHRPDRFRISVRSDTQNRDYYYDGKTLTVVAPTLKYYAQRKAPPTIRQVLAAVQDKYGIDLPLADLFEWGTDPAQRKALESGYTVRPAMIDGRACVQYAFRQPHVDWQVWIAASEPALPCKLVITNRDDPSLPQYSAVMKWQVGTAPTPDAFAFKPPAGFSKIALADNAIGGGK